MAHCKQCQGGLTFPPPPSPLPPHLHPSPLSSLTSPTSPVVMQYHFSINLAVNLMSYSQSCFLLTLCSLIPPPTPSGPHTFYTHILPLPTPSHHHTLLSQHPTLIPPHPHTSHTLLPPHPHTSHIIPSTSSHPPTFSYPLTLTGDSCGL